MGPLCSSELACTAVIEIIVHSQRNSFAIGVKIKATGASNLDNNPESFNNIILFACLEVHCNCIL